MPTGRYFFIPFLRMKSQMGTTKNRSSKKSHKKTNMINISATNISWEQLTMSFEKVITKSLMIKHFYNKSELMRVIDDDITPHNSSWNEASTKELSKEREKEFEIDGVREIKREREREGKKPHPTEWERELAIFSDSATSSFLTLLVTKS